MRFDLNCLMSIVAEQDRRSVNHLIALARDSNRTPVTQIAPDCALIPGNPETEV